MLNVKNLTYKVRHKTLIQDISLDVNDGEFVGVIGPNGSGKSTLLKNIYKMLTPDSGEILLDGESMIHVRPMELGRAMGSADRKTAGL